MAVINPRLVLVCALPAVITILTVLWTRRRRKPLRGQILQSKQELTEETQQQVSESGKHRELTNNFHLPSQELNHACEEVVGESQSTAALVEESFYQNKDTYTFGEEEEVFQQNNTTSSLEENVKSSQSIGSLVNVQLSQGAAIPIVEAVLPSQSDTAQLLSPDQSENQNLLVEKVQKLSPKMHVKSDENQLSAKLDHDCHLSPQGGSTSDLSERQSSPVNSDTSLTEVVMPKPRRNRGGCRLSEESRDSAMGGEEELPLADGSVCVLLEATSPASFSDNRTEFGQDYVLPEVQPQVNGESGCYNDLDEVLESPPPSIYSDGHSEGSCDSGKGGSDIQAISSNDLAQASENALLVYEFELAQDLCGRLIGRQGKQVNFIKNNSNANVFIKTHPFNSRLKLCAVQGTKPEIKNALELIRKRFPLSQYPGLSLVQVNVPLSCGVMVPETLQLHLPEGVTCDVILSSMVSAGHFFVQQLTHPTYPSLNRLDTCMTSCYAQMDTPQLPLPVEVGVICACPVLEGWFRAQVVNLYENSEECDVKFVDYGGYSCVPMTRLRQIRSDFMTLPFQASECYLANVKPNTEGWSLEACATFEELAQGQILQSLVVGHAEDGIPYVHLYRVQGVSTVFINRELVSRGVAQWVEIEM